MGTMRCCSTCISSPAGIPFRSPRRIRGALAEEQKSLPPDVKIASWYDQSDLITSSAKGVRDAVMIGVGLAAMVLLLFLRNLRMTLIAILAVPVVLAITALLLYVLGQSFNIMTLGGMAAAVGLIIDDAIVDVRAHRSPAACAGCGCTRMRGSGC